MKLIATGIVITAVLAGCSNTDGASSSSAPEQANTNQTPTTPQRKPIDVGVTNDNKIKITATADTVQINNVVANRGNCIVGSTVLVGDPTTPEYHAETKKPDFPKQLSFGQSWETDTYAKSDPTHSGTCNVIEVSVDTNQGSWVTSYQPAN